MIAHPEAPLPPEVIDALRLALPDADGSRATVIGTGWDVIAWRVPSASGEWTLRVPRHAEAVAAIEAQTCLAGVLERHGLPVPADARLLRSAKGRTLAGLYRYVDGQRAEVKGRGARARLASALARFLTTLHAIEPGELATCRPRHYAPWPDEFAPMIERTVCYLGPVTAAWVRARGEDLAWASRRLPPPVLLHADLKPEHVLLDGDGGIVAVLDFESVQVSDPALDFSRLIQNWDRAFAEQVLEGYGHPVDADLMERAQCYRDFDALAAIDSGVRVGQDDWLPWGRRALAARAGAAARSARVDSLNPQP